MIKKKRKKLSKKVGFVLMIMGLYIMVWKTWMVSELVKMNCAGFSKVGTIANIIGNSFIFMIGFIIFLIGGRVLFQRRKEKK